MADKVRMIDNDKISRQALLDEINEEIEYGEEHFHPEDEQINKGLKIARKLVRALPAIEAEPVNGWISVKDRLPKLGERVMAFCKASILTFLRYDGEVWFEMSSRNEYLPSFVTHWQHLPEPPKGE